MSWILRSIFGSSAKPAENAQPAPPASEASKGSATVDLKELEDSYEILCNAPVEVALLNADRSFDVRAPNARVFLLRSLEEDFSFSLLIVSADNRRLLEHPLSAELPVSFLASAHVIFFSLVVEGFVRSFRLTASSEEIFQALRRGWFTANWESARKEPINKGMNAAEIAQALESFSGGVPMDDSPDLERVPMDDLDFTEEKYPTMEDERAKVFNSPEKTRRSGKIQAPIDEDDESDEESEESPETPEKPRSSIIRSTPGDSQTRGRRLAAQNLLESNDNLAVGITSMNRTYVGRGAQLGVFRHDNDGQLSFVSHIPTVKTVGGDLLTPSRMMLHEGDRKMILLNPNDQERAYLFDIEAEKVVAEFGGPEDFKIRNVGHTAKYAEATGESTFLGVNNVSVFLMDPRRSEKNKIAMKGDQVTPMSTCVTTTGEGQVAVGSARGEIRLYNDISKRAKSLLPGLGDPIIGIDVTEQGKWILATTKNYLMLIDTEYEEGKRSGFKASMATKGRAPIKLQLAPQDLTNFNIPEISFTPAHFDIGENIEEQWIVASTGPFIITWNFRKIKQNRLYDYKIKRCGSNITAESFLFNQADRIVVTMPDAVVMEQRAIKGGNRNSK